MNWLFNITATSAPRLLMRLAMIFDQQLLTLEALDWRCDGGPSATRIRIEVRCEEALAHRLQAKLFHLQDIVSVDLLPDAGKPPMEEGLSASTIDGICESS